MVFDGAVATSPGFAYPDSSVCKNSSNPTPTISGTPGGEFTAVAVFPAAAVLVFTDGSPSSTGTVDLAASDVGAYQITYTVGGVSETDAFSIQAVQISTFSYSSSSLQQIGTASPTFAVGTTAGGTFAATSGIIFQDTGTNTGSSTGVINLGLSTIGGPYTITYTSPGPCASSSTFDVSVTAVAVELIENNFAMEFDAASSQYVDTNLNISGYTNFTYSGWIKQTTVNSQQMYWNYSSSSSRPLFLSFTGNIAYFQIDNSSYGLVNNWSTVVGGDDVWFHLAVSFNGAAVGDANRLKVYVNGLLKTLNYTGTIPSAMPTLSENIILGSRLVGASTGLEFDGDMDEIAMWNRTLELEDIQRIYNATNDNPGKCANLFTAGLGTDLVFWNRMGD